VIRTRTFMILNDFKRRYFQH